MPVPAVKRDVVGELMDFVRRRGFARGDRLPSIRDVAAALDAGRNAVRDAMVRAQAIGLVRIEPRLGIFVHNLDADLPVGELDQVLTQPPGKEEHNVFHLLDARLLVEVELVGKAAQAGRPEELLPLRQRLETLLGCRHDRLAFVEADESFHMGIARVAANPVLLAFLRTLLGLLRPIKLSLLLSAEDRDQTDREHREIFQCLLAGDAAGAQEIMRTHLALGRALLLQHLQTPPG